MGRKPTHASLILKNGKVATLSKQRPTAEAIAILGDRILRVGSNSEVNTLIGDKTRVIDLKGKTVLPGLIDAHVHIADFGRTLSWINLSRAKSIEDIKTIIKIYAAGKPKERWIIGYGWDESRLIDKRPPRARDLDEASPENPTILYHHIGRKCVVNTKALKIANITAKTEQPPDGEIEKDPESSEPTGVLHGNATDLVWRKIPQPSEDEIIEHLELALRKVLEYGITTVHWIAPSLTELNAIKKLVEKRLYMPRIRIIMPANYISEITHVIPPTSSLDSDIKLTGAIVFVDGALAARKAALTEPYNNGTTSGQLLYTEEEINRFMHEICRSKLQPVMHAMGDKAMEIVLETLEKFAHEIRQNNLRPRIEQPAVSRPELIRRMKDFNVSASIQPLCIITEFKVWSAMENLGPRRARWLYPLKTLIFNDVNVCGGSDAPMEPINPFTQIKAAVTRQYYFEERVTLEEAFRMYTINAAYAVGEENLLGTIEEGKLADLIVVSTNPLEVTPESLDNIKVEMTMVGGRIVYSEEEARNLY